MLTVYSFLASRRREDESCKATNMPQSRMGTRKSLILTSIYVIVLAVIAMLSAGCVTSQAGDQEGREEPIMTQPGTSTLPQVSIRGIDFASYTEAQTQVFFQLREPTYVPSHLKLNRVALFVLPAETAQTPERKEAFLQQVRTADWKALGTGTVWVTGVYIGADQSWKSTDGYFVIEQGSPAPFAFLSDYPEDRKGTVTLADGSQAIWIRGAWNAPPSAPGAQLQDTGVTQLYWEASDGVAFKLHVYFMSLDEAVKIANSFQPVPRG